MAQVEGSTLWMLLTKMRTGVTHSYQYYAAGKPLGARGDAIGYNPDSYARPGVPRGKVSEKQTIVSKIYDGMKSDYWVYASPGVDPAVPAALMVWQDGQGLIGDYSRMPPFHRHGKPGRAETAAAHRACDDLARPIGGRAAPCGPSSTTR